MALTLVVYGSVLSRAADGLPPFKVTGQHMTAIALLVPKETTNEQLKALVFALRKARQEKSLGKLLPPTTSRGSKDPYGIVVVYVYSEPEWATSAALQKCSNASANTPLYIECGRHVRAHYFYGAAAATPEHEEGMLGYAEGKRVYTKVYEKLF